MEQQIKLQTKDSHIIYGTFNSQQNAAQTLLIFVHGLTGHQNEHHYFNAVSFFTKNGFDTFRFNFYSKSSNARQLSDCTISIHVEDLKIIINNFKKQYKNPNRKNS